MMLNCDNELFSNTVLDTHALYNTLRQKLQCHVT